MSQSLVKNMIHLVFSTKHRAPMIPVEIQPKLWAFQAGVFNNWNSPSIAIGGVDDHIHALFLLSKTHELCKIVEEVKKASSKWIKIEGTGQNDFYWQAGYAAFSQFADAEDRWHPEVGHCFERVASDDDVVCQTGNRISFARHGCYCLIDGPIH